MMFHFIFLLISLSTVNGIDPWETVGGFEENGNINKCTPYTAPATKQCESSVGDTFYKKLLSLIVYNGKFQERDDNFVVGTVHFEFPSSEFEVLKEFLSRSEPLTPQEFRRADGIISENIFKLSWAQQVAERWTEVFVKWWELHYTHIFMLIAFLACLYMVYRADWSRIRVKVAIFAIFFTIVVVWEIILALKEAELKDYKEFAKNNKQCSNSFWKFWEPDCQPALKLISHYWQCLHPLKLLGSICSKLIAFIITPLHDSLNDFTDNISDMVPFGLKNIVRIGLNIFLMVFFIILAIAIILNIFLNRPLNFNFLFLNLNLGEKKNNSKIYNREHYPSTQSVEDYMSGANLKTLLNIVDTSTKANLNIVKNINVRSKKEPKLKQSKIKQKRTERIAMNSSELNDFENSNINRKIILEPKSIEEIQPFDKTHRRVSSMPDQLYKLGGGDYL